MGQGRTARRRPITGTESKADEADVDNDGTDSEGNHAGGNADRRATPKQRTQAEVTISLTAETGALVLYRPRVGPARSTGAEAREPETQQPRTTLEPRESPTADQPQSTQEARRERKRRIKQTRELQTLIHRAEEDLDQLGRDILQYETMHLEERLAQEEAPTPRQWTPKPESTYIHCIRTQADRLRLPPIIGQLSALEIALATIDVRRPKDEMILNGSLRTLIAVATRTEVTQLHTAVRAMQRALCMYCDITDDNVTAADAAIAQFKTTSEWQQEIRLLQEILTSNRSAVQNSLTALHTHDRARGQGQALVTRPGAEEAPVTKVQPQT
ncbi:MAG: hypothetical protein J3Q66DRAFT_375482 [Benniella sp.]|nr:MAG: hypothetical protein J3Q66DRAFT_375482 [Benniella sp.]